MDGPDSLPKPLSSHATRCPGAITPIANESAAKGLFRLVDREARVAGINYLLPNILSNQVKLHERMGYKRSVQYGKTSVG